jgi:hypothetical protein
MHRLNNVNREGALPRVRVGLVRRQRAISVRKGGLPVHNAVQGVLRQEINVGREVRHLETNVGVGVVQANTVRRVLLWVKRCQLHCKTNRIQVAAILH